MGSAFFRRPIRRHVGPPFIRVSRDTAVIVLCGFDDLASIRLHWSDVARGSVVCLGLPGCQLCPAPCKEHAYAPALEYHGRAPHWRPGIIDLGSVNDECAQCYSPLEPIWLGREKTNNERSRMVYRGPAVVRDHQPPKELQPWDVRPQLMRRWGLFDEATILEREPYFEQKRLQFSGSTIVDASQEQLDVKERNHDDDQD